eukprot:6474462-Amphidinium_carterae.1
MWLGVGSALQAIAQVAQAWVEWKRNPEPLTQQEEPVFSFVLKGRGLGAFVNTKKGFVGCLVDALNERWSLLGAQSMMHSIQM